MRTGSRIREPTAKTFSPVRMYSAGGRQLTKKRFLPGRSQVSERYLGAGSGNRSASFSYRRTESGPALVYESQLQRCSLR